MAFRGIFEHTLDAKGRLTVPARFRGEFAEGAVLAMSFERCVAIWMPSGYAAYVAAALRGLNPASPEAQQLSRFFSANSIDTELDAAGRVMIPAFLMQHAALAKDVVVTGADTCLELWDRAAWAIYNAELTARVPNIAARLGHTA